MVSGCFDRTRTTIGGAQTLNPYLGSIWWRPSRPKLETKCRRRRRTLKQVAYARKQRRGGLLACAGNDGGGGRVSPSRPTQTSFCLSFCRSEGDTVTLAGGGSR